MIPMTGPSRRHYGLSTELFVSRKESDQTLILGGMGPVDLIQTTAGKLFAAGYALFSGVVFLVAAGVFGAPLLHRILHHFHLEIDEPPAPER